MSADFFQYVEIPSVFALAKETEDRIIREAEALGYNEECLFALQLSLEEALTNAIRHGNGGNILKKVKVHYRITPEQVELLIADEGEGFDPARVPDPTQPEFLARPSGRGIMLMRAYMNVLEFNATGNSIHMIKYRHQLPSER